MDNGMEKQSGRAKRQPAGRRFAEIDNIRKAVALADRNMIKELARRKALVEHIARIKKAGNIPVLQRRQEKEMTEQRRKLARKYRIDPDMIERLFRIIIRESRSIQKRIIIKG